MPRLFIALLMGAVLSSGAVRAHCDQQGGHQHGDSGSPAQRQR
jgi:hypothetical protein